MKLKVTHSASPCAASARRASSVRTWGGAAVAKAPARRVATTPAARHRGRVAATPPQPGRIPGSILAANPPPPSRPGREPECLIAPDNRAATSLRQDGTATVTRVASRDARKAHRCSEVTASSAVSRKPPSPRRVRSAALAVRCQAGGLPAWVTAPARRRTGRAPCRGGLHRSGISAGSMPRSKRWRASETIWLAACR